MTSCSGRAGSHRRATCATYLWGVNRYRWAFAGVAAAVVALIAIVALLQPQPQDSSSSAGGGAAGLIAVSDRQAAPEFTGIDGWVNSSPLTVSALRSKVVLIDFWTFSCVNCTRTLPHLRTLLDTYGTAGLSIVGVHSPEFDFEKDQGNVRAAVQRLGISWPVAVDSEMATWNAWSNRYWPAEYLIDQSGRIAYAHFGEGDYDHTAAAVAALLGSGATPRAAADTPLPDSQAITPELYAGSTAAQQHGGGGLGDGEAYPAAQGVTTTYPAAAAPATQRDAVEVSGSWIDRGDSLEAASAGHVRLRFHARDVFVVAGSAASGLPVTVTVDGAAPGARAGANAPGGALTVRSSDLYQLLTGMGAGDHVVDLAVPAGFRLFTFTFG